MADTEVDVREDDSPAQDPLVEVTFQKNTKRTEKYLEAEPKVLGVTQIGLSMYQIIGLGVLGAKLPAFPGFDIPVFVFSLLVLIAGILAVTSKNLHLPTLRACLGMQIVACVGSLINMVFALIRQGYQMHICWRYRYSYGHDDSNGTSEETCKQTETIISHLFAGGMLIHAVLVAIAATLAVYCCKVVNCCGPTSKIAVITVRSVPEQPREG